MLIFFSNFPPLFLRMNLPKINAYMATFSHLLKETLPSVHSNFTKTGILPTLFLFDWIVTLFSRSFSIDVVARIWDNYFLDGQVFLFRTSLAVIYLNKEGYSKWNMDECLAQLGKVGTISEESLFSALKNIRLKKVKVETLLRKEIAKEQAAMQM